MKILRNALNFRGRASRTEAGLYFLFCFVVIVFALILFGAVYIAHLMAVALTFDASTERVRGTPLGILCEVLAAVLSALPAFGIVVIALLALLGVALLVRRLHDLNRSGWWLLLLGFVPVADVALLIYLVCARGGAAANRYGEAPHQAHK